MFRGLILSLYRKSPCLMGVRLYNAPGWKSKRVYDALPFGNPLSPFPPAGPPCWPLSEPTRKANSGSLCLLRRLTVGKKLYVGNLTYQVGSSDLEQLFSAFGDVQSAQVIEDRDTSRSKGFGFVEMGSEAEAQAAIQGLHDQDHNGRRLTVNEAKPREAPTGGGYGGGGGRGYRGGRY